MVKEFGRLSPVLEVEMGLLAHIPDMSALYFLTPFVTLHVAVAEAGCLCKDVGRAELIPFIECDCPCAPGVRVVDDLLPGLHPFV